MTLNTYLVSSPEDKYLFNVKNKDYSLWWALILAGICLFKVSNGNTRTMCEICSKLTIKTRHRCHWRRLMYSLLTLNRFHVLLWCFHCWLWKSKCRQGKLFLNSFPSQHLLFQSLWTETVLLYRFFTLNKYLTTG